MFRIALCLMIVCTPVLADDEFQFEDRGFRLVARNGEVHESAGFRVSATNGAIPKAEEKAKIEAGRQDDRYNRGVNRLGEAGHGVAYPLYKPVYTPIPVAVPVAVPYAAPVVPHCTVSRARYLVPHCSMSRANLIAPHCTVSRAHMMFGPYPY